MPRLGYLSSRPSVISCSGTGRGAVLGAHNINPWDSRFRRWSCTYVTKRLQLRQPITKTTGQAFNGSHYDTNSGVFESWDPDVEEYRSERRTTYNFDDWKKHRSWQRYFRHFKTLPRSGIFNSLVRPVAWVTMVSVGIMAYVSALQASFLPSWLPHMLSLPIEPFQLTSFALSLLLVFRTNSSYQRWFEGRRRFGAVTHFSRDLARQAFAYFKPHDMERKAMFARWLVAFFTSVYCQLRENADLEKQLRSLLRPAELKSAVNSANAANYCLQVVSSLINSAGISPQLVAKMDNDLTLIVDALSSCERIVSTPIPLSYTRHTARFMMMWLFALPFSLWASCGWLTVPITLIVSYILLGIEEIGVQIEEPFGILALERMVNRNKEHVFSMYREHMNVLQTVYQFERDTRWAQQWTRQQSDPGVAHHGEGSLQGNQHQAKQQQGTQEASRTSGRTAVHAYRDLSGEFSVPGWVHPSVSAQAETPAGCVAGQWQVLPDPNTFIHPLASPLQELSMVAAPDMPTPSRQDMAWDESNARASSSMRRSKQQGFVHASSGNGASRHSVATNGGTTSHRDMNNGAGGNGVVSERGVSQRQSAGVSNNANEGLHPAGNVVDSEESHSMDWRPLRTQNASTQGDLRTASPSAEAGRSLGQAVLMNTYLQPY